MSYKRIICYALVLLWMAIIFAFSHQTDTVSSGQSGAVMRSISQLTGVMLSETLTRKGAHMLVYVILAVLLLMALRTHAMHRRTVVAVALAVVFIYATSDEIHQIYIPGRSGQVSDVHTAAGIAGIYLYIAILKYCVKNKNYV